MPQFLLSRSKQASIAAWLREKGILMRSLPGEPVQAPDATWQSYVCKRGRAWASLLIGEHEQKPEDVVLNIGTQPLRWLRLWNLARDRNLVREISRILETHGGQRLED